MANANGTVVMDYIDFNIADTSEAGRTINLQSELPELGSNITIDGTTQPGSVLGISVSKVILYLDHYTPTPFTYLYIHNASFVNIYGMCFKFFTDPRAAGGSNYGIYLRNSSHIVVGSAAKGNMFSAVGESVTNNYWNYYNDSVSYVTIQGNIFGYPLFGGRIDLLNAAEITIGGDSTGDGNILLGTDVSVVQSANTHSAFFSKIVNNKFNLNADGTVYYYFLSGGITLTGNGLDDTSATRTFIKGNILASGAPGGIGISNLTHKVIITGNKLGTDITGTICEGGYDRLIIFNCANVTVGGYLPGEENILRDNISMPMHGVHIIKNQFGWIDTGTPSATDPHITILTYDNGLITGKANPNAIIQLYTNTCYTSCVNVKYYATISANAAGDWSFPYTPDMPNIIATATIQDSSTSAFTEPMADLTTHTIKNATCGKSDGSITGITVSEGTHIRWENSNTGQVISSDTDLVNVPAGNYELLVYNGLNGCPWNVEMPINGETLPDSTAILPTDASCGKNNGSLQKSNPDYTLNYKWMNANHDSIGNDYYINNLFPGNYYLKLSLIDDSSCNKIYGPYSINNQSGPTLNTANIKINASTCSLNNGSITGLTASNVNGTPVIEWYDSLNNLVGNSYDLPNILPGKYHFIFKDAGGCDTIQSPYYTVPDTGTVEIDTTGMLVTASSCSSNSGSIQHIKIINGGTFSWENTANNSTVGSAADIFNLPSGNYVLLVTNMDGCTKASPLIVIPQSTFSPLAVTASAVTNALCSQNTGSVNISSFSGNTSLYTFRWVDSASGQNISTHTSIANLAAGAYQLFAKDNSGCEKDIYNATIVSIPPPVIDYDASVITSDECRLMQGGVSLSIAGLSGPTSYTWYDENDNIVGTGINLQNVIAGTYTVTVTDATVCIVHSNPFIVVNDNSALQPPIYTDVTIPRNADADINIENPADGDYSLYFAPGATQPAFQNNNGNFIIPDVTGDTTVFIKRSKGVCNSNTVAVHITVVDKSYFTIPNAFTPNGDGINDKLEVRGVGITSLEYFRIYNQWGKLVFETHRLNDGWDGIINGALQNPGVFVWMAQGKGITGATLVSKGTFVLIR